MDYINSDRLLFILASPGGGGYRMARIVSCLDNVHWYQAIRNGRFPWRIFSDPTVKGKDISSFHFDRRTPTGMIPLVGERVERFWNDTNLDEFYNSVWSPAMEETARDIDEKYIPWVLHDTANYILDRFPNAKVINLVDTDITKIINRYIETTAVFPIKIENKQIKPSTRNEFSKQLDELEKVNPEPTYRDFWAWTTHSEPVYLEQFDAEYLEYVSIMLTVQHAERIKENPKYINVTWDNLDINAIMNYLGAKSIDENYIKLLN